MKEGLDILGKGGSGWAKTLAELGDVGLDSRWHLSLLKTMSDAGSMGSSVSVSEDEQLYLKALHSCKDPVRQLRALQMLGCSYHHYSLAVLQSTQGIKHYDEALKFETSYPTPCARGYMEGDSLRLRENELAKREKELEQRERWLQTASSASSTVDDDDLRALFEIYDTNKNGFISKAEFKKEFQAFESYGCPLSDRQIDAMFTQYSTSDELTYTEFCILMLQRARM